MNSQMRKRGTEMNNQMMNPNPETARAVEEYLIKTGVQLQQANETPQVLEINGGVYAFFGGRMNRMERVLPDDLPEPQSVQVFSLNGLVDMIRADVDGMFAEGQPMHIVRVTDETTVEVLSTALGVHRSRYRRILCKAPVPRIRFGEYLETEDFQVMMQTCFTESEARNLVMRLAGSMSREQSMRKSDDGMTQTVQVQTGVVTVGDVSLKNPVPLTPLRTFYEVDQVTSPFILRFDENAKAALYEGDGGAWRLKAVTAVADWLRKQLKDCNVCVIG